VPGVLVRWALGLGAAGLLAASPSAAVAGATGCPDATHSALGDAANLSPAFSPEGRRLLFESSRAGEEAIYVMTIATCRVRRVTAGMNPDWSPDGKRIVFQRSVGDSDRIFVARGDGTRVRQVTRGRKGELEQAADWFPSWSRGGQIAFDRDESSERTGVERRNIYVVRPDGRRLRRLTRGWNVGPEWSPDGLRIAWSCGDVICVMNGDGKRMGRVTNAAGTNGDESPAWAPNGKRLVFARASASSGSALYVVPIGGKAERLTHGTADGSPDWSPDGKWIAFERDTGRKSTDLFLIRPDGSGLRRLTVPR
jgi:TolB protein